MSERTKCVEEHRRRSNGPLTCEDCRAADIAAAEERGRRSMELGTCRVYRHGCADGRAIENSLADRWREYALPHPNRDNCVEWVALAPRDSGKDADHG